MQLAVDGGRTGAEFGFDLLSLDYWSLGFGVLFCDPHNNLELK